MAVTRDDVLGVALPSLPGCLRGRKRRGRHARCRHRGRNDVSQQAQAKQHAEQDGEHGGKADRRGSVSAGYRSAWGGLWESGGEPDRGQPESVARGGGGPMLRRFPARVGWSPASTGDVSGFSTAGYASTAARSSRAKTPRSASLGGEASTLAPAAPR